MRALLSPTPTGMTGRVYERFKHEALKRGGTRKAGTPKFLGSIMAQIARDGLLG
jgi:hypothetical protein